MSNMNVYINGLDLSNIRSVLLICPEYLSEENILEIRDTLYNEFPDCHFVLLQGDFNAVTSTIHGQHVIESQYE